MTMLNDPWVFMLPGLGGTEVLISAELTEWLASTAGIPQKRPTQTLNRSHLEPMFQPDSGELKRALTTHLCDSWTKISQIVKLGR